MATISTVTLTVHYFDRTPAPDPTCVSGFAKAQLAIDELAIGHEKLQLKMVEGPSLAQAAVGNPAVPDGTDYRLCVYDGADALVGLLRITRGGHLCTGKPCWQPITDPPPNGKGYKYKDRALTADGVQKIITGAASSKPSKLILKARGNAGTMPLGIAAALEGTTSVTMQFVPEDGATCLSATLNEIITSTDKTFRAR